MWSRFLKQVTMYFVPYVFLLIKLLNHFIKKIKFLPKIGVMDIYFALNLNLDVGVGESLKSCSNFFLAKYDKSISGLCSWYIPYWSWAEGNHSSHLAMWILLDETKRMFNLKKEKKVYILRIVSYRESLK